MHRRKAWLRRVALVVLLAASAGRAIADPAPPAPPDAPATPPGVAEPIPTTGTLTGVITDAFADERHETTSLYSLHVVEVGG
jgi:hypothetical protein